MENFKALGIKSDFIKGLNELGIINPTQIQAQVIPLLLVENIDLVGQAPTTILVPRSFIETEFPN